MYFPLVVKLTKVCKSHSYNISLSILWPVLLLTDTFLLFLAISNIETLRELRLHKLVTKVSNTNTYSDSGKRSDALSKSSSISLCSEFDAIRSEQNLIEPTNGFFQPTFDNGWTFNFSCRCWTRGG